MIYGYARVSTKGQAREGNSLEAQVKELEAAGATKIFIDTFTGTSDDRPEFKKLMIAIEPGDTLVVTKLDRFARSIHNGSMVIDSLLGAGVKVNILNIGLMSNSPSSKLIRNIFFAFAEFERELIVDRTQEGKAIARQHPDFRDGRPPKFTKKQLMHALDLLQNHSYKQVEELTGISKSTLVRAKKKYQK